MRSSSHPQLRILWTVLSYLVLLLGLPVSLLAGPPKQQQIEVKASDTAQLQQLLEHRKVEGMFVDETYLKGRVEEVSPGSLFLKHAFASEQGEFEINDLPAGDFHLTTKLDGLFIGTEEAM